MDKNLITIENLDVNNLPELQGMKEQQLKLVEENQFIEIIDNKTFEEAKKRRTALLKGRTSLKSQEDIIVSKLTNFRKQVGVITKELIDITLPHEEKQQEEVKRYEQVKENERLEKERLEAERIEKIKANISGFESKCNSLISEIIFENIKETKTKLDEFFNSDIETEEFDVLLQQAKTRVQSLFDSKHKEVQEKEMQRLENERLVREKAEADAKLKAIKEQQEKERLEREQKELEEKEKVFEVRKNRLCEIGFSYNENSQKFSYKSDFAEINIIESVIYGADVLIFEEILTDSKKSILEAKEHYDKQQAEKEARKKAEIETKKKTDKEAKERAERLAKDKAIYKKVLNDDLSQFPMFFDADQVEVKEFSELAYNRVQELKNQLLIELENL